MDDPEFDARWRVFAADEARVQAPGRVGPAVMAAWDAAHAQPRGVQRRRRRNVPALAVLAAVALLLAAGLAVRHGSGRGEREARGEVSGRASEVGGQVAVSAVPVPAPAARLAENPGGLQQISHARASQPTGRPAPRDGAAVSPAAVAGRIVAGPIVTLAADQAFETEALHIMRVRVPRDALQPFGLRLLEPEASRLVDVDVLVGDDGLARDIRRIRSVVDAGAGYNR